jgi:hypothetical protein
MQTKLNNTPTLTARNVDDSRWIGSRLKETHLQSSGQETEKPDRFFNSHTHRNWPPQYGDFLGSLTLKTLSYISMYL